MKKLLLLPLILIFFIPAYSQADRPQEPKPPFPYISEEVKYPNKADTITLAGTFTKPQGTGTFPAVILIGGSGATTRNGDLLKHKPLWVLADYLTRKGMAVLRFDERGVGTSGGNALNADIAAHVRDVHAAFQYLSSRKDVDPKKIGIIGHSEGGAIGLAVAAQEPRLGFLVSMAGPGVDGRQMILSQTEALYRKMGVNDSMVKIKLAEQNAMATAIVEEHDTAKLRQRIISNAKEQYNANFQLKTAMPEERFLTIIRRSYLVPEYISIIRFDPSVYYPKVKCPVLALNGSEDIQIIPGINLEGWKKGIRKITVKELAGTNHLFQECKTCKIEEYGQLTQTISPVALDEITQWLRLTTGLRK